MVGVEFWEIPLRQFFAEQKVEYTVEKLDKVKGSLFKVSSEPLSLEVREELVPWTIHENRGFQKKKKKEIQFFFHQRHALWTSLDIFVVTYGVTNFLPKLIDILLFSMEKN